MLTFDSREGMPSVTKQSREKPLMFTEVDGANNKMESFHQLKIQFSYFTFKNT